MNLNELILRRKSCRSYTNVPVEAALLDQIAALELKPLYPEIHTRWQIVPRKNVRCICPWTTPQVITVYSEPKPGYLENVGFLFQQFDLQLQRMGLGVCWLGMGRPSSQSADSVDGMDFVIMLAFGHPKGEFLRTGPEQFHRKKLLDITDREDSRLEPARLAPSSVNSQPWFFLHDSDVIHVYCACKGLLKPVLGEMNRIDIGIALAHLYVSNSESFRFFQKTDAPQKTGYAYLGSLTL